MKRLIKKCMTHTAMNKTKMPERRCVSCRNMKEKKELIRIVRFNDFFEIDLTYKKPGRGAYICKSDECFKKIFKKKSLEASFRSAIPHELYQSLMEELNMS